MYYVYLIENRSPRGEHYVGMTTDLKLRLREHNIISNLGQVTPSPRGDCGSDTANILLRTRRSQDWPSLIADCPPRRVNSLRIAVCAQKKCATISACSQPG